MSNKNGCDILIGVFFFYGRDIQALIPLKYYLEKKFSLNVKVCSVLDPYLISIYNPKLVLVENTVGSNFHVDFASYAKKNNRLVISLSSEIEIKEEHLESLLWGYNYKHEMLFDRLYVWTPRVKRLALNAYPELTGVLRVSGGLGFDRYKIYRFLDKRSFLEKYSRKGYKYIVTYAGYVFSQFFSEKTREKQTLVSLFGEKHYSLIRKERAKVRSIIEDTIRNNKDVLFILKQHPGEMRDNMEMSKQWEKTYPNVLYFKDDESISDLINVSDIWLNYISTSSLEAWLLEKPTISIVPTKEYGFRNIFYKGSVVVGDSDDLKNQLNHFKIYRCLKNFDEKARIRKEIINSLIYKNDGLNSWRVAKNLYKFINRANEDRQDLKSFSLLSICYFLQHIVLLILSRVRSLPFIRKSVIVQWYSEENIFKSLEMKYKPFLESFSENLR